jgi:hypothetical protein
MGLDCVTGLRMRGLDDLVRIEYDLTDASDSLSRGLA